MTQSKRPEQMLAHHHTILLWFFERDGGRDELGRFTGTQRWHEVRTTSPFWEAA